MIAENLSQDKWVKNSDGSVKVTIDENLSVNISASGEIVEETKAPTIIVNKHEVNFGDTAINLKGGVQRIKISPSHQRCELKYELGGTNPDAFIVSEEEWDPYTGGTLSVDFLPTAASEYSATLTITSHDGNPVTIQLSGKGIQDQVTKSGSISKNGSDVKYEYFRGSKTLRIYGTGEMQSWNGWEGVYPAWMWWSDDISRVVIEEGVTSIGNCAFLMCKNLTSVSIPSTVATVESGAFYECTKLTTIEFPDSVQTIEDSVFYDCWELTSVKLPKNLKVIDGFLFYNCYKLSSVNIPDGVEEIKLGAFYQCFDLPSINLPEGLATLEQYAFAGCESVTNVKIPAGVTNIGNNAFESCVNLKTVELPSTLESIDVQAFYNYISLETVSFPETLSLIGDNAFGECSSLTSVKLSESLRTLGKDAFSNCTNLELLEIAPGLTSIGETAFSGCSKLALATIPDTVNSLEKGAFYGCSNLKALSLPGVTFIGENALDNMTALEEVELNASTPITLGAGNFTSDKVRILVPAGTADAYKAAPGFNAIPEKIYDNASDFHPVLDQNGYADAYAAQEWQADENGHWKWCAVCSSYKVAYEAHNQDTTVAGTAATCITDGLTDGANCSVCGVETRNQQAINALTHEMQEVAGTAQASTCTQTGKEADKQCARTGCDYRETGATIEVVAHDYEMKIISQPTVEAVGSKQEVCKVCGDAKEAIVIEKLPAPAQPAPVQPEQQQPAASAQPAQPVQPEQKPAQPTDSVVQQPEQQVQPEQPAQPVQPIAPEISTAAQQIVATSEFAANTEATAPDNASQSTEKAEATNVEDKGAAQEAVAENENPLAKSATPADQNQGLGFNILEGLYLALAGLAAAVLGFFVVIRRKRNKEEQ